MNSISLSGAVEEPALKVDSLKVKADSKYYENQQRDSPDP